MPDLPDAAVDAAEEAIIRAASDFSGDPLERSSRKLARAALETAAPVLAEAAGAFSTREDDLRMAAEALAAGNYLACPALEDSTDDH
jgi:hypothetical protein